MRRYKGTLECHYLCWNVSEDDCIKICRMNKIIKEGCLWRSATLISNRKRMVTFIGDAGLLFLKCSCWRCWGTDALHAGKHIRIEAAEVSQSENGWTLCIQMFFVVSSLPMQQGAVVFQPLWAQVLIYSTSPPLPLTAQPEPSVSHGEAPLPSRQAKRSFCAQLAEKKNKPSHTERNWSHISIRNRFLIDGW